MIKDILLTLMTGAFRTGAVLLSLVLLFALGGWIKKVWLKLKQSPPRWAIDTLIVTLVLAFFYVIGL